jgi:hypothetical protein
MNVSPLMGIWIMDCILSKAQIPEIQHYLVGESGKWEGER